MISGERKLHELMRALGTAEERSGSVLEWLTGELPALLDAEQGLAHGLRRSEEGLEVDFCFTRGIDPRRFVQTMEEGFRTGPQNFVAYDPLLPQAVQRNQALDTESVIRLNGGRPGRALQSLDRAGIHLEEQLRVLVCEGPALLAWVGCYRSEPFEEREVRLLQALVPALRQRLVLERQLAGARLHDAAFGALLQALGQEAYLVHLARGRLRIVESNALGEQALAHDRAQVVEELLGSLSGRSEPPHFAVTRLEVHGLPGYALAVRQQQAHPTPERLLPLARQRWGLTPRQCEVLAQLVEGRSNKGIAAVLGCAEVTVENHVTQLFHKSGATSRAGLVTLFWKLGG